MGRKAEPGITYYRMDCQHIRNKKVRLLINEFDSHGYWVWQCILAAAYEGKGYYFDCQDKDALELFASEVCKKRVSQVEEIITGCVRRSLFDEGVFTMFGVLSSTEMQEVYLDATAERRRKGTIVEMDSRYLLIPVTDTKRWENVQLTGEKIIVPRNNPIVPVKNNIDPQHNPQSKVKESKVKEESELPDAQSAPPPPKDSLEVKQKKMKERQELFYQALVPFVEKYNAKMIRAFFNYWSEPNKSKTKMKYELEVTWDLSRRLETWEKNEQKFNKGSVKTAENDTTTDDANAKIRAAIQEAQHKAKEVS